VARQFEDVISDASPEDRQILAAILEADSNQPDSLRKQLRSKTRTLWQKLSGRDLTYVELLQRVGEAHKMRRRIWESDRDFERRIVRTFYRRARRQLTPPQRKTYYAEASAAASIAAMQVSGFGVYQMATTVMGMASAAAGVRIPFIGYMALTKAIFLAIGPLGWAAISASLLHKITKPDYSRIVVVIAWMFAVREQTQPQIAMGNYSVTEIARKLVKLLGAAVPSALLITSLTHTRQPAIASTLSPITMNSTQPNPALDRTEAHQDATPQPQDSNDGRPAGAGSQDENAAIITTISGWASALAQNDPTVAASYYAKRVDRYFLRRNVTREFVEADKRSFIEHGKRLDSFSTHDLQFESSSPEAATVSLTKHWEVLDGNATTLTQGRTRSRLWLKQTSEGWKITGEQDLQ